MTTTVAIDVLSSLSLIYLVWTVNGALVMQNSHSTNWWTRFTCFAMIIFEPCTIE